MDCSRRRPDLSNDSFTIGLCAALAFVGCAGNPAASSSSSITSGSATGTHRSATGSSTSGASGLGSHGSASLSGDQSFAVQGVGTNPVGGCGGNATGLDDGGLPVALRVMLGSSGVLCDGVGNVRPQGGTFVDLRVTTPDGGFATRLAVGTYPLGSDTNLCDPASGGVLTLSAFVDGGGGLTATAWTSLSGSVTLTSVDAAGVSGTFQSVLGSVDGQGVVSTTHTTALSGIFSATDCP